jgi:diacylglycerol kinase
MKGLRIAFQEEHNFRLELGIGLFVVGLGVFLGLSTIEWLFVVLAIGMVLAAEVFNTALEELCDMLRQTHDPHVAKIKDLSAAAVLVSSIMASLLGALVFLPYLA